MNEPRYRDIFDQTIREGSTVWSGITGLIGSMSISEWCLLITAIITILNFIKNWYIDYQKLKMERELHVKQLKGFIGNEQDK